MKLVAFKTTDGNAYINPTHVVAVIEEGRGSVIVTVQDAYSVNEDPDTVASALMNAEKTGKVGPLF